MSEGTIIKWHKKPGDKISPGDVLCDIQTDKAVMSFETEEEGILAKILVYMYLKIFIIYNINNLSYLSWVMTAKM